MAQSRIYRTEAIVLRQMDYAEADRILTLLTPQGKVSALAKGIRRVTSRKVGHLGLFYRAELVMARGRNMDIVSQAESIEAYEGMRHDLVRFTYACYLAELADRFAQEEEDSTALYDLMASGLGWLAEERDPALWVRYFELRLLSISGYQPQLFQCVACHAQLSPEANLFDLEQGGLACPRCGLSLPQGRPVSLAAQKVLRYLATRSPSEVRTLHLKAETHDEVEALLQRYLEHTLERELRSVAFLNRLRQELAQARARAGDRSPEPQSLRPNTDDPQLTDAP